MLFVYGLEIETDRGVFKARETLIWGLIKRHFSGCQLRTVGQWETPNHNFLNAGLHCWWQCLAVWTLKLLPVMILVVYTEKGEMWTIFQ